MGVGMRGDPVGAEHAGSNGAKLYALDHRVALLTPSAQLLLQNYIPNQYNLSYTPWPASCRTPAEFVLALPSSMFAITSFGGH